MPSKLKLAQILLPVFFWLATLAYAALWWPTSQSQPEPPGLLAPSLEFPANGPDTDSQALDVTPPAPIASGPSTLDTKLYLLLLAGYVLWTETIAWHRRVFPKPYVTAPSVVLVASWVLILTSLVAPKAIPDTGSLWLLLPCSGLLYAAQCADRVWFKDWATQSSLSSLGKAIQTGWDLFQGLIKRWPVARKEGLLMTLAKWLMEMANHRQATEIVVSPPTETKKPTEPEKPMETRIRPPGRPPKELDELSLKIIEVVKAKGSASMADFLAAKIGERPAISKRLQKLVKRGILIQEGGRKYAVYKLPKLDLVKSQNLRG